MIRKNFKIATWSLVLSIATLLLLTSSLLLTYTDIGKRVNFFHANNTKFDLEKAYEKIDSLIKEKDLLMYQLKEKLKDFEELKTENSTLKSELEIEHQKVEELTNKIDSLEKDVSNLMSLKEEMYEVIKQSKANSKESLLSDNKDKIKNKKVVTNDSVFGKRVKNTTFNDSPIKDIVKNEEEVRLLNSIVKTFHIKDSGVRKETNDIDKVNTLELLYTIYKDKTNNKKENTFYIQLFDTNNKNVGNTQSIIFEGKELIYSFLSKVESNESINNVIEAFSIKDLNLDRGVYFLNIFSETGKLLSTRSFRLE